MKVIFLLMCCLTFVPALTYMVMSDGPRLKVIDWGYDGFQQQGWGAERPGAAGAGVSGTSGWKETRFDVRRGLGMRPRGGMRF